MGCGASSTFDAHTAVDIFNVRYILDIANV